VTPMTKQRTQAEVPGGTPVDRRVRRRLRRAILAEARRVAREHNFGCDSFNMDTATGQVTRVYPSREHRVLSDLLHLCAQLDGRVPVDA